MRLHRATAVVALLGFLGNVGCAHYWVEERSLDEYAALPRDKRLHAVVPATRVTDGKSVLIRASEARQELISDGTTRRRVRVLRPLTVSGLVLMGFGAGWFVAGMLTVFQVAAAPCKGDGCGLGAFIVGMPMIGASGLELTIGGALAIAGATSPELHAGSRRFDYLP